MSSSHDEQPLTRRQLRELERQKPRKEREADAKAAEEAEAARKAEAEREAAAAAAAGVAPVAADAPSRRALRAQGPADQPEQAPAGEAPADEAPADEAPADEAPTDLVEDTIIPEVVADDDATRVQPVIDIVPLDGSAAAADDEPEHAEIINTGDHPRDALVEEMVIDVPIAETVDPTAEAAAHVEAEEREAAQGPTLAPLFQSPSERTRATAGTPSSFDELITSRNAAAANSMSTTSALVLPTVPGSNDVGTALDETGEVIITGSIDLPASFGSLGAPASGLEANDLDSLLERNETELGGSDVAPVAASRAISTNTSSTSLITPPKRARANAPVVLAVTAGVLAVGVVGLLLAVFVFRVF